MAKEKDDGTGLSQTGDYTWRPESSCWSYWCLPVQVFSKASPVIPKLHWYEINSVYTWLSFYTPPVNASLKRHLNSFKQQILMKSSSS